MSLILRRLVHGLFYADHDDEYLFAESFEAELLIGNKFQSRRDQEVDVTLTQLPA